MSGRKTAGLCLISLAVLSLLAAPAAASLLDTGTPFDDGNKVWRGTSVFPATPDPVLGGSVDWVVYAPGQFPFAPSTGYTPAPNEYTYVYQLHSTGSAPITNYSVGIDNYADNLGKFVDSGHGVTGYQPNEPMTLSLPPDGAASWDFNGVGQNESSCGLVYSSPHTPLEYNAIVINHGEYRIFAVPSPSANPIPEPATTWALLSGLGMVSAWWWIRRR
jgi:hypothetical protein